LITTISIVRTILPNIVPQQSELKLVTSYLLANATIDV